MQTEHLFELTYILLEKKRVTAAQIARHFGISIRTVYRWVDALNLAGVPVFAVKGKGGGIQISENYALEKTVFTEEEKQELLSSLQALNALSGNYNSAITKLRTFTKKNADWIEIDFSPWNPKFKEIRDFFNILKTAILDQKKVQFNYFSSKGETGSRVVEPQKIVFRGQAWYLKAFCLSKNEVRFFKISRMANVELLAEHFLERSIKSDEISKLDHNYSGYKEDNVPLIQLKLKVMDKDVYRIMDEYKVSSVEDAGDCQKILTFQMPQIFWLTDWLLSFGSRLEVLEPESVRLSVKEEIRKMAEKTNM